MEELSSDMFRKTPPGRTALAEGVMRVARAHQHLGRLVVNEAGILTLPRLLAYFEKEGHAPCDLQTLANSAGTYFEDRFREYTAEKYVTEAFKVLHDSLENFAKCSDFFKSLAKWYVERGKCVPAKKILKC